MILLISFILLLVFTGCEKGEIGGTLDTYNAEVIIEGVIDEDHVEFFSVSTDGELGVDQFNYAGNNLTGDITGLSETKELMLVINNDGLKDGKYITDDKTIKVDSENNEAHFEVVFAEKNYNVSVTYDDCTVEGYGDNSEGEEVELKAIPDEGYEFLEWTGYIESEDNPLTFDMPAKDVEVFAYFKELEPAYFDVKIDKDSSDEKVIQGAKFKIKSAITNVGEKEHSQNIKMIFQEEEVDSKVISLEGGEQKTVEFNHIFLGETNLESADVYIVSENDTEKYSIKLEKIGKPNFFNFIMDDEPDKGEFHFYLNDITDNDGNIFVGGLIGENNILAINYDNSRIKFYWECSDEFHHRATLFFEDIGYNNEIFKACNEKEFSTMKRFSETTYEKNGKSYIKEEWFEFINMLESFSKYEVILDLSYEGEKVELSSGKLNYDELEVPNGSAFRAITGTARDTEGNPIEEVKVVIWTETENQNWRSGFLKTDKDGEYGGREVRLASEYAHYLTVEKSGYKSKEKDISLGVKSEYIKDGCGSINSEPKIVDFILEEIEYEN